MSTDFTWWFGLTDPYIAKVGFQQQNQLILSSMVYELNECIEERLITARYEESQKKIR